MKRIDTSAVTGSTGMPLKSGSVEHLQSAYGEAIGELAKGVVGSPYDPTKVYILNGLVNIGVHPNYNISAGSVFFNGEVYLVPAATFTVAGPNVSVGVITTSFFSAVNADPVEFTDGVPRSIHQIRRIILQSGLSGSGAGNFLNFVDVTKRLKGDLGEIKMWDWRVLGGALTDYFNVGTGLGIHPYTLGWRIFSDLGGKTARGFNNADANYNAPYTDTGGSDTVSLVAANNGPHSHSGITSMDTSSHASSSVTNPGNPAGVLVNNAAPFGSVDIGTGPTGSSGTGTPFSVLNSYLAVLWIQRYL